MTKQSTHTLRLRDGRVMEYAEFGDPTGRPLLYFHGFLGSCQQGLLANDYASSEGIRIIAPNRPGIGMSSPHKYTAITDYADDIVELADHLTLDTFTVMGASGGGCFALGCAYALPERVCLAGVIGGIAPLNAFDAMRHLGWFRRLFLKGCTAHPMITRFLLRIAFGVSRLFPKLFFQVLTRSSSIMDETVMSREDLWKILWWDYEAIFQQPHGISGLMHEAYVYFHWGFDLKDFPRDKRVLFWHGMDDTILPWSVIKLSARHIQHHEAILRPGGHLAFLSKVDEVLLRIKQEWQLTDPRPRRVPILSHARNLLRKTGSHARDIIDTTLPRIRTS